jgi:Xaa-Pro dipeptidase
MISRRTFVQMGLFGSISILVNCKSQSVEKPVTAKVKTEPTSARQLLGPSEPIKVEPLSKDVFTKRQTAAQKIMAEARLSCLFLTPSNNLYYLSGIRVGHSERLIALVLPRQGDPVLICPYFEEERLRKLGAVGDVQTWQEDEDPYRLVKNILIKLKVQNKRIGLESTADFDTSLNLKRVVPGASLLSGSAVLDTMRMIKSEQEVEFITKAAQGTEQAINRMFLTLVPGLTERDVANELSMEMKRLGGESGGGIVQFGPASAMPHAAPGNTPLEIGHVVLADVGMRIQGYTSDITRTAVFKRADADVEKIYDIVLKAQRAGQAAAQPGVTCESVDQAARRVIDDAGYGQYFTHRLGHGIGLDGHEKPYLVKGNKIKLQPGMTVTIEPGIYLPGKFGVRIEDDFVITEDGCKPLSTMENTLRII